jgi:hypothetical protein
MRSFARTSFCLLIGICSSKVLKAQNYVYATGAPSFSTQIPIENGFINVNNGDVHIELPLATHTQRGRLQLNERLIYDSRIWRIIYGGGAYAWSPTNVANSMGGWTFSSGAAQGTYTYNTYTNDAPCYGAAAQLTYSDYYNFTWTDPQGTSHPFSSTLTQYYVPNSGGPHCLNYAGPLKEISTSNGYATDGSGYHAVVSNYTTLTVYDNQGNVYHPNSANQTNPPVPPGAADANGNYWSQDSNGNLIDTLGRTPVLTTQSGNQIIYQVLGYGGAREQYTVTTESVPYSTAFAQSGVGDVSGSFTAIQSIALPDGSSYSFTYDSSHYGELASVTLPTGGVIQYTYTNFLDSYQNQNRWLHTRVKDGGTTTFTPATITNCTSSAGCQEKTTVTSPAGNDTVYTFTLDKGSLSNAGSWNSKRPVLAGCTWFSGAMMMFG